MNLDMIFFLLTLACFVMLIWGMIKPTKTFLGPESTRSKVVKVYGFGFIALFMAFIAAIPKPTSVAIDTAELTAPTVASIQPAVAPAASPAPPEKTLGFSAEDFRKNFNGIVAAIDSDFKLAEFDIEPGTVNNTFKRTMGKNIGIFGTVGKQSGNLKELMIIVGGTDSNEAMDVFSRSHAPAWECIPASNTQYGFPRKTVGTRAAWSSRSHVGYAPRTFCFAHRVGLRLVHDANPTLNCRLI